MDLNSTVKDLNELLTSYDNLKNNKLQHLDDYRTEIRPKIFSSFGDRVVGSEQLGLAYISANETPSEKAARRISETMREIERNRLAAEKKEKQAQAAQEMLKEEVSKEEVRYDQKLEELRKNINDLRNSLYKNYEQIEFAIRDIIKSPASIKNLLMLRPYTEQKMSLKTKFKDQNDLDTYQKYYVLFEKIVKDYSREISVNEIDDYSYYLESENLIIDCEKETGRLSKILKSNDKQRTKIIKKKEDLPVKAESDLSNKWQLLEKKYKSENKNLEKQYKTLQNELEYKKEELVRERERKIKQIKASIVQEQTQYDRDVVRKKRKNDKEFAVARKDLEKKAIYHHDKHGVKKPVNNFILKGCMCSIGLSLMLILGIELAISKLVFTSVMIFITFIPLALFFIVIVKREINKKKKWGEYLASFKEDDISSFNNNVKRKIEDETLAIQEKFNEQYSAYKSGKLAKLQDFIKAGTTTIKNTEDSLKLDTEKFEAESTKEIENFNKTKENSLNTLRTSIEEEFKNYKKEKLEEIANTEMELSTEVAGLDKIENDTENQISQLLKEKEEILKKGSIIASKYGIDIDRRELKQVIESARSTQAC